MKFVQKENFEPKIKPIIENLQNELYQLKKTKQKVLNFVLTLGRSWRAPKHSSEFFKDRICKFKQYLNYILMIINQNILRTFLYLQKNYEKLYTKQTSTAEFLNFLGKVVI